MTLKVKEDLCLKCGAELSPADRLCPTCKMDAGVPNVRECKLERNINALLKRYEKVKSDADIKGLNNEFKTLELLIDNKSGVVISIPASFARSLFENKNVLYKNYENLVGNDERKASSSVDDKERCAVGGLLFGSYAKHIIYGVLSLSNEGLSTYGDLYCRLKTVTIDERTTFLEKNSYVFVRDYDLKPGNALPDGYRSCWKERKFLVLAKITDSLVQGQGEHEWQSLILKSDGVDRNNDDFIEAHIFDGFDRGAIDSIIPIKNTAQSREVKMDLNIAMEAFNKGVWRK